MMLGEIITDEMYKDSIVCEIKDLLSCGKKLVGRHWKQIRKLILIYYDYTCNKCHEHYPKINVPYYKRKLEVHHIIPVKMGGLTIFSNLEVLCVKCHRRKSSRYYYLKRNIKGIKPLTAFMEMKSKNESVR